MFLPPDDEEMEAEGMIDPGMEYVPPPSSSLVARKKLRPLPPHIKREADSEDDEGRERDDDFESAGRSDGPLLSAAGGGACPERRRSTHPEKGDGGGGGVSQSLRYAALSLYEERMLLRRLDGCPLALAVTPQAKRLHRKLLVRQAKRQRGLPLLDIDRAVSATLSLVGGIYGAQEAGTVVGGGAMAKYCTNSQELRILDRFQVAILRGCGLVRGCGHSRRGCGHTRKRCGHTRKRCGLIRRCGHMQGVWPHSEGAWSHLGVWSHAKQIFLAILC